MLRSIEKSLASARKTMRSTSMAANKASWSLIKRAPRWREIYVMIFSKSLSVKAQNVFRLYMATALFLDRNVQRHRRAFSLFIIDDHQVRS